MTTKTYKQMVTMTVYVANDGTEFKDETECMEYEAKYFRELDRYVDDHTYTSWWGDLSGLSGYLGGGGGDDRVYLIKVDPKVIEWAKSFDLDLTEHENKPVFLLETDGDLYFEGTLDSVIHAIGADLDWLYKARKELL